MRDLITAGLWASAAFGVALAVGLPASLNAVDRSNALSPAIADSTLTVQNVKMTVRMTKPTTRPSAATLKAGDRPAFELMAFNDGTSSIEVPYILTLTQETIRSPMSRTISMPETIWSISGTVALAPKESKAISYNPDKAIGSGGIVSVVLLSGKQSIVPIQFALTDAKATPDAAALKLVPATMPSGESTDDLRIGAIEALSK